MLPRWSNFNQSDVPALEELRPDEKGYLYGGSGGVYVLRARDGKRYTVKTSSSKEALKDEIFSDATYSLLGYKVPLCGLYQAKYNELPESIQATIPAPIDGTEEVIFRLAEFIESAKDLLDEDRRQIVKAKLPQGFVVDCFLANTDVV